MTISTPPPVSILIATRNRDAPLARLLDSLEIARQEAKTNAEIIVVDNGSSDTTPSVLSKWTTLAARRVALRVEQPGKSRALNQALKAAGAPLLAFLDDDETVAVTWLDAILRFCTAHPMYASATGRVLPPPGVTDPTLLERLQWYRTIAFFDGGDRVRDQDTLYGGNMVVRRQAFDAIGAFDERLGPGARGGLEDIDLAARLRQAGLRIGYMPEAIVYHAIDPQRLTLAYFRHHNHVAARSAYVMNSASWRKSVPRVVDATLGFLLWSLLRQPLRREHARGRLIRHAEMIRLRLRGGRDSRR